MAKPIKEITPANRLERWKKLWSKATPLDADATDAAFEEFQEAIVPGHMQKMFLKRFGVPKAQFGNRFFLDDTVEFTNWDLRLEKLIGASAEKVEAIVIYGSPDALEAHTFTGERRRTLRDLIIDDWQAACAIVRAGEKRVYVFIEPKMRGVIVRVIKGEGEEEEE
ncbi:hypothetical protein EON79_14240 [bacterium]|nr:MAG: hypothetical protein EON79_14240 [bacterium]